MFNFTKPFIMPIRSGFLILCLLAEMALGIYTYLNFESLFIRFMFFVLTVVFVAMIVIKLAGPVSHKNEKAFPENLPEEKQPPVSSAK